MLLRGEILILHVQQVDHQLFGNLSVYRYYHVHDTPYWPILSQCIHSASVRAAVRA